MPRLWALVQKLWLVALAWLWSAVQAGPDWQHQGGLPVWTRAKRHQRRAARPAMARWQQGLWKQALPQQALRQMRRLVGPPSLPMAGWRGWVPTRMYQ